MKIFTGKAGRKRVLLIAAVAIFTSQASADTYDKLENSWYVGGGLGLSQLEPDGGNDWNVTDNKDLSTKVYAGYDIGSDFGLEAFWNDFGDATVTNTSKVDAGVSYRAYGANLVYHVPSYMGAIHPIVKLGVAKVKTEGSGVAVNQINKFDVMGGIGAEYQLENGLRVRAEYERYDEDLNQLSIGLNWRPTLNKRIPPPPKVVPKPIVKKAIIKKPVLQKPKTIVKHVPVYVPAPAPKPVVRTIVKQVPAPAPVVQRIIVNTPAPKPQPKVIHKTLAGGSNFATNSSQLTTVGRGALNRLANDLLRDRVVIHNISIIGHTDSIGSNAANLRLSQQRATTVANYLSSRGLSRNLMTVLGRGEAEPVANNTSSAGRAKNRRVNLIVKGSQTVSR